MGVDYLARKAAKKARKREQPKRDRKKNGPRRACRGLCYLEPGLLPDDTTGDGESRRHPKNLEAAGELAKARRLAAQLAAQEAAAAEAAASKGSKGSKDKQQQKKRKGAVAAAGTEEEGLANGAADAATDAEAGQKQPSKRLKLSTAVNLLDARTARGEAPRAKPSGKAAAGGGDAAAAGAGGAGAASAAVPPALAGQPELIQRFMVGEGLAEPMPVQERCWPVLLDGRDAEVVAEPGAGKTLGYLLPGAELLARRGHGAGTQPPAPLMLVVLPTRELAQQVAATCRDLRKHSGLRAVCLTGGSEREEQAAALASRHPHIVVATPGRLLDLVDGGDLSLAAVRYVVLDEADKMLGMGFQPQIEKLRGLLLPPPATKGTAGPAAGAGIKGEKKRKRPQVALFTATMPESLGEVAAGWLQRPKRIHVSHSAASISRSVTQVVQVCAEHKKPAKLAKHLSAIKAASKGLRNPPRVLIFANRIKTVRFLHNLVTEDGYRAAMLHGDRSQEEREQAMHDFRSGKVQILVATDVAARGLHIRGLPYVVNYDFPSNLEQYIHRAGRTGRLAADGHAFSFFTREMAPLAEPLLSLLREHEQAVDPNLVKLVEAYKLAAERLGMVAAATGEEPPERPQTDDVLRTLGLRTKGERKRKKGGSGDKAAAVAAEAGESDEEEGGDEEEEEAQQQQPAAKMKRQGSTAGAAPAAAAAAADGADAAEPAPFFISSKTFKGARPGYKFQKGMKGVGYYLDAVQQAAAGGAGGGKGSRAAQHAQQARQKELKEKYARAPIGGPAAAAAGSSGGGKGSAAKAKAAGAAKPAQPKRLLPGQVRAAAREAEQAEALGGLGAGLSDSEGEEPATAGGAAAAASKRKRALPGRLRKKLAGQRKQQ